MGESYDTPTEQTERRRNSEESFEYLNDLLKMVEKDISRELEEKYGTNRLIGRDCSIRMDAFYELDREQLGKDKESAKEREKEWSGINNPGGRNRLINEYGLKKDATDQQILEKWSLERGKGKSKQLEMVVTVLLHKAFGDRYIVVRSSKYDDYFGHFDNVIVNKETGAVICAVDEVRENVRSERRSEKEEKILEISRAGGAKLAYGFTFNAGQIELRSLKNLPIFCLGLNEDEYDEIVNAVEYKSGEANELNSTEKTILDKILASIRAQRDALLADPEVQRQHAVVENLKRVDELLE